MYEELKLMIKIMSLSIESLELKEQIKSLEKQLETLTKQYVPQEKDSPQEWLEARAR